MNKKDALNSANNAPQNTERRRFVIGASAMMSLAAIPFAKGTLAKAISEPLPQLSGKVFNLSIDYKVVMLSDWSDTPPKKIYANLKNTPPITITVKEP